MSKIIGYFTIGLVTSFGTYALDVYLKNHEDIVLQYGRPVMAGVGAGLASLIGGQLVRYLFCLISRSCR